MKGVWKCRSIIGGTRANRLVLCSHWQVHNGHPGKPKRIDVCCDQCGTRHQHVPDPRDARGRDSRILYLKFPMDVDLELLIQFCSRRNAAARRGPVGFVRASEL